MWWIAAISVVTELAKQRQQAQTPVYAPPPKPNYMPYFLIGGGLFLAIILLQD